MFVISQNRTKEVYTSELDTLWSRSTHIQGMTPDGNWVWFNDIYDNKVSKLHLIHTSGTKHIQFQATGWLRSTSDSHWFGYIDQENSLQLINLKNDSKEVFPDVQSYSFSNTDRYIATYQKDIKDKGALLVKHLKSKKGIRLKNVVDYLWHPTKDIMLVSIEGPDTSKIMLCDLSNMDQNIIKQEGQRSFKHLLWSGSGNVAVFTEQGKHGETDAVHYYNIDGTVRKLNKRTLDLKFPVYEISNRRLYIDHDGTTVFFYKKAKANSASNEENTFEVWDTRDAWIYPKMKRFKDRKLNYKLTAWRTDTNELTAIETDSLPSTSLDPNHSHALVFDPLIYEPLYKEFSYADLFVKHIESGKTKLVVKNQYLEQGFVTRSPSGNYIAYFRDNHWWVYHVKTHQTVSLTKDIHSHFEDIESDYAGDTPPFGNPGWSLNDDQIILYDQYDIWLISPDGSIKERLTQGRETKIKYRISKTYQRNNYSTLPFHPDFTSFSYDLDKGLPLELSNDDKHQTGYAIWNRDRIIQLAYEPKRLDDILMSKDYKKIVYRKQKFNESPSVCFLNLATMKSLVLYKSNTALDTYDLGHAETIRYLTKTGDSLQGTLMYPANFDPNKKYPMLVYIYEKLSSRINAFVPPSDYGYSGFNALKYTTNGYFVLYPDIKYSLQDPGVSALHSVSAAVNKALETEHIDKERLGLIGHSFGGYETAFIVTQTDLFKVAVAGAAVTDLTSHYHSVGWNGKRPEMWRYEGQQWRMGDSYYDSKTAYHRNSPRHHVQALNTPLLLWAGKEDLQVHWTQSVAFYLAMRRLNKSGKLLLFHDEKHYIGSPDRQKKLSIVIKDWFDSFCK